METPFRENVIKFRLSPKAKFLIFDHILLKQFMAKLREQKILFIEFFTFFPSTFLFNFLRCTVRFSFIFLTGKFAH